MDVRFQVCFTPLAAVLFAFPSRYWFTIGHHLVFSLGEWSPRIRTGFHVSRPTWDADRPDLKGFRLRGFHPLWPDVPVGSAIPARAMSRSLNPGRQAFRFGLLRVRSPLLAQSRLLSPPRGTEMFHFPRCRSCRAIFVHPAAPRVSARRVPPFGYPRIKASWRLPVACRSLVRPSSPYGAKASIVRPYTLSKRFSLSRYVAILFNFQLTGFQRSSAVPRGAMPCAAQRVSNIPKRPLRRKGADGRKSAFFRNAPDPRKQRARRDGS